MIGLRYPTPLSLADRALIDLVTTRYESIPAPFVAFDSGDGYIELRSSETIRISEARMAKLREQNASKPVTTEAPSVLLGPITSRG